MTIKKSNEFARFEWKKSISTHIGDIDARSMTGKPLTKHQIESWVNGIFDRLVTCTEYGKVYGKMNGGVYSGTRIHNMADNKYINRVRNVGVKTALNKFVINGIMFILMTQAEYEVYNVMSRDMKKAHNESGIRKYLMSHPKTKDDNDRVEKERKEAVKMWKSGRDDNALGVDMAYHGEDWDYFFTEVFPTWENKVAVDSVGMWCASAGYYANSDSERGAVKKVRCGVGDLWKEYREWCNEQRYIPLYVKQFSLRMVEMGFMKRFSGGRSFDVFVGSAADMGEWEHKRAEREAAQRERMAELRGAMRVKRDDTEFLVGLSGRWQAGRLWSRYEEWCRGNGQQLSYGKRNFYKWLDSEGWKRETVSGTLWMELSSKTNNKNFLKNG